MRFLATPQNLDALHMGLARFWFACDGLTQPPPGGVWRREFDTAIGEIGANIVRHAYADLPPAPMSMRLRLQTLSVIACFIDTGRQYKPAEPVDSGTTVADILSLPEGGMGLAIAAAALDRLRYRRICGVNVWRLIKRLPG